MIQSHFCQYLRNPTTRQLVAFAAIGSLATITHAASAVSANIWLGLTPFISNLFGYCCAVLISYFGNARLTFKRRVFDKTQFFRFFTISIAALGLSQLLVVILTGPLNLSFAIALIPVTTLVPMFSFAASKLWAFRASY